MKRWTDKERSIIKEMYPEAKKEHILRELQGRSWIQIRLQASILCVSRCKKVWNTKEDMILRENYSLKTPEEMCDLLPRWNWQQMMRRAYRLRIERGKKRTHYSSSKYWTREEDRILEDMFSSNYTKEQILEALKDRTWEAISIRANKKNMYRPNCYEKYWTDDEVSILRKIYPTYRHKKDIENELSRWSWSQIKDKANALCLSRDKRENEWSDNEEKVLKEKYGKVNIDEMLRLLPDRNWMGIITKVYRMRLVDKSISRIMSDGEKLMKSFLDIILVGEQYIDNCRPEWLINDRTNKRMEIDRFYPELSLAFEYNGRQHYRFSEKYHKDENEFKEQQYRDLRKIHICQEKGIQLFVFGRKQLSKISISKLRDIITVMPILGSTTCKASS